MSGPRIKRLWHTLPTGVRHRLYAATNWTGVPSLLRFAVMYRTRHAADRFAGELPELLQRYPTADSTERVEIMRRFEAIADAIILPNGVRKTTYANRHQTLLQEIMADPTCALPQRALRVLDLPASTGASSLGARAWLARHRRIETYVLADLAFHLLYDRERGCIFDAGASLLQVRHGQSFRSVYLPYAAGGEFTLLTRLVLAPLSWRGARLRTRFRASDARSLERISVLHPDVLGPSGDGCFVVQEMDAFAQVPGVYDLILSCNLLQHNYFSPAAIARGTANLGNALAEDGLLIIGSPDEDGRNPHRVYRKRAGRLELIRSRGTL